MDEDLESQMGPNRRRRLVERLDGMVESGRVTEQEAGRLRAASGPDEFDQVVLDIRLRHAGTRFDEAVGDGSLSRKEADGFLERLRTGEHPRRLRARLRLHAGSRTPKGPEDLYATSPPWDIGRPQPAFLALAEAGAIRGRVLDVGCGTGEHVLMCAGLGLDATGVDLASAALRAAEEKARDRGRPARFLVRDARHLADLGETFDTALDSGLFHSFDDDDRAGFVDGLRSVVLAGGRCFMLCISDREPGEWGRAHGITKDVITAAFAHGWRVDSIESATIDIITDPDGVRAWLVALTRT